MKPKTKDEFKKYAEAVYDEISKYEVSFQTISKFLYNQLSVSVIFNSEKYYKK